MYKCGDGKSGKGEEESVKSVKGRRVLPLGFLDTEYEVFTANKKIIILKLM